MATVLLLEDDPATRERLAGIVAHAPNLALAAACGDLAGALAWLGSHPAPDVLLVDLQLPDGSGIELIRAARRMAPQAESMVISVFGDEAHVVAAIEAGATGYLLKDASAEEIATAIERLRAGEAPISSAIARHLLKRFRAQEAPAASAPSASPLTPRENEVLQLIAKGLSYQRIADTLDMSPHTVTTHIKQIYRKLAVNSRGEAVFEAMQLGLLPRAGS
ncbi:MAG: response regulator transcription factor [Burkholderiales bacterium]|nr:response regulator transcription factor [Burkholderiales bacterium]GIK85950.1 MAG: DNA-binding response regulator [Betaproteobacteria bacterium]